MAICVEDRISNFPDHIRCHILSFLPIKEAVRTSIISTKWRYLFASISTVVFDTYLLCGLTHRNVGSFKNFVDRLLKFPGQLSLDCFRLRADEIASWNDGDHDFDVSGWICGAVCRGVKEIDLYLDNFCHTLPALLFTCHSLLTLTLTAKDSKIIEVPSEVCLRNLKTLCITNSVLVGDSLNRLISNCHVLEDLAFDECSVADAREVNIQIPSLKSLVLDFFFPAGDSNYVVVINAPNLVYFRYDSVRVEGYSLSNMKSLEKAEICIWFDSSNYETSATHLFQGICNVRSLWLNIHEVIPLTIRIPIFHNLIEFEFYGRENLLVEFLHCTPNLKTLTVKFQVMLPLICYLTMNMSANGKSWLMDIASTKGKNFPFLPSTNPSRWLSPPPTAAIRVRSQT
ncbi:F-box/LRR-repeat protein At4g14103 [Gossypium hirsutum]|uniref:F-box/LRR-repeat protein At4g14103 n=1 Tax=Gossypium hirsutum TaxID=3635 RepID=A0ABM2ZSJ7_GOSHI|nr:F-box/LRR-repeat protein At4g14103-like [Gossypium hirsutum]